MNKKQETKVKSNKQKNILFILLVLVIVALVVSGYLGLCSIREKIKETEGKVERSVATINHLQNSLQELQDRLQESDLIKTKNWRPIVIEHLVRMADLTLNTTGNVKMALSFLLTAKRYASSHELSVVKNALGGDIASLQALPVVDPAVLVLKIDSLSQRIAVLPMVATKFVGLPEKEKKKTEEQKTSDADIDKKTLSQRFFASVIGALKNVVAIRHRNVEPLLLPEQEIILRLNIQAMLLQIKLAVMERQDKVYKSNLEEVAGLLGRYFSFNSKRANSIIVEIQKLKKIDLQPILPSLMSSIAAVRNLQQSLQSSARVQNKKAKGAKAS